MVSNLPNILFQHEECVDILSTVLSSWTEIPLSPIDGYDKNYVRQHDRIIGTLLRETELLLKNSPNKVNNSFFNSWMYKGKLYRIIHVSPVEDARCEDGFRYELPKIDYHGMIAHWTTDYTFKGLMYKLSPEVESIILEADAAEHIGFDINRFRKTYGFENSFLTNENEVIFPMYKNCITEYKMSINDFIQIKNKNNA